MITEQFSAHYRIDFFLTRVGNEITLSLYIPFLLLPYLGNMQGMQKYILKITYTLKFPQVIKNVHFISLCFLYQKIEVE